MSNKTRLSKSLSVVVGAAFVGAFAVSPAAMASGFQMNDLDQGYQLVGDEKAKEEGKCGEGKCGEGKCGGDKAKEGKCGEGKCGGDKAKEGKCGEGKCGADKKKDKEGSCGGMR